MPENNHDVFISYSSKEKEYAYELKDILESNGISCWIAPLSIPEGATYLSCAPQSLRQCRIFLLVLSSNSQQSPWVSAEVESAFKYHKIIIPYVIDNAPMKDEFNFLLSKSQRIEAYNKKAESIETLVTTIKNTLEIPTEETKPKKKLSVRMKILIAVLLVIVLAAIAASPFIGSYIAGLDDIRGEGVTYAESGEVIGEWKWRFDEGAKRLTISGQGALPDIDHDHYEESGWWQAADPYLGEVDLVIEEGITAVGTNNFLLLSLRSVSLPQTLTEIHESAFYGNFITEIKLPDGLEVIGDRAFQSCEFVRVDLPQALVSIGDHAFEGCFNLERIIIDSPKLKHIGEDAFYALDLEEISFTCENPCFAAKDGVLYSADYAELLYYPYGKEAETFVPAAGVKTIKKSALEFRKVKKVILREGVTTIEDKAFFNSDYLEEVTLPDTLQTIGESVFSGCENLRKVTLPDSVTVIPRGTFKDTAITEYRIPDTVTELGAYAFADCIKLTSVTLPDGVTAIPHSFFDGCVDLTDLTVPDSVTEVGSDALKDVSMTLTIHCTKGSYIDGYAKQYGIKTEYIK